MIRNCTTHGLNLWMIKQKNYVGLNFASRNLLDSAAGGTFMEITLGDATKLLDNIMNFTQLDHEHVAQAWERMKLMIRNCPTHGLNL